MTLEVRLSQELAATPVVSAPKPVGKLAEIQRIVHGTDWTLRYEKVADNGLRYSILILGNALSCHVEAKALNFDATSIVVDAPISLVESRFQINLDNIVTRVQQASKLRDTLLSVGQRQDHAKFLKIAKTISTFLNPSAENLTEEAGYWDDIFLDEARDLTALAAKLTAL